LNEIKYNDIKFLADVIGIQKSRSLNNRQKKKKISFYGIDRQIAPTQKIKLVFCNFTHFAKTQICSKFTQRCMKQNHRRSFFGILN